MNNLDKEMFADYEVMLSFYQEQLETFKSFNARIKPHTLEMHNNINEAMLGLQALIDKLKLELGQ
jgi:hypothetical protein